MPAECRRKAAQQRGRQRLPRGFTLIELLIVLVIVGVLTAIALPNYSIYVTRARLSEAETTLSDWRVRMDQYYFDHRSYQTTSGSECGVPAPSATAYFSYSCQAARPGAYALSATGLSDTVVDGFVFSLDQTGLRSTLKTPSSAPWDGRTSQSEWITR